MSIPEAALVAHMMLNTRRSYDEWPGPPLWWRYAAMSLGALRRWVLRRRGGDAAAQHSADSVAASGSDLRGTLGNVLGR